MNHPYPVDTKVWLKVTGDRFEACVIRSANINSYRPSSFYELESLCPDTIGPILMWLADEEVVFLPRAKPKLCTCGARAVGSNGHSSWCDIKESI